MRAGPGDALVVAALTLQLARESGAPGEDGYLDRAAAHWAEHRTRMPVWIAQREREHAGYLQAVRVPEMTWPGSPGVGGAVWVQQLFVAPAHRGRGVGGALVAACEEWAKGARVRAVRLRCEPGADGFWAAAGYRPLAGALEKRL